MSDIRRVVTGLDAEDRAVVQFDSQLALEPGPFGINSVNLWITDSRRVSNRPVHGRIEDRSSS